MLKKIAAVMAFILAYESFAIPISQASLLTHPAIENGVQTHAVWGAAQPNAAIKKDHAAAFQLPSTVGTIIASHVPHSAEASVYLIQDIHDSVPAQINLAEIVSELNQYAADRNQGLLVAVEGGDGLIDTDSLSAHPIQNDKTLVTSALIRSGFLFGEEYAAINSAPGRIRIEGIENIPLYNKNVAAKMNSVNERGRVLATIRVIKSQLNKLKIHNYSSTLFDLEKNRIGLEHDTITLSQYLEFIAQIDSKMVLQYPMVELILEANRIEKKIDFAKVEKESRQLVEDLLSKSNHEKVNEFMSRAESLRSGRLSATDYYTDLIKKSRRQYPAINLYLAYLRKVESVDTDALYEEMQDLELALAKALSLHPLTYALYQHTRWMERQEQLFSLTMTPREWGMEKTLNAKAAYERYAQVQSFVDEQVAGIGYDFSTPPFSLNDFQKAWLGAHQFYVAAESRDAQLVKNFTDVARRPENKNRLAAIIAGGFHTPGIVRELARAGVACHIVRPQLKSEVKLNTELNYPPAGAPNSYLANHAARQFLRPVSHLTSGGVSTVSAALSRADHKLGNPASRNLSVGQDLYQWANRKKQDVMSGRQANSGGVIFTAGLFAFIIALIVFNGVYEYIAYRKRPKQTEVQLAKTEISNVRPQTTPLGRLQRRLNVSDLSVLGRAIAKIRSEISVQQEIKNAAIAANAEGEGVKIVYIDAPQYKEKHPRRDNTVFWSKETLLPGGREVELSPAYGLYTGDRREQLEQKKKNNLLGRERLAERIQNSISEAETLRRFALAHPDVMHEEIPGLRPLTYYTQRMNNKVFARQSYERQLEEHASLIPGMVVKWFALSQFNMHPGKDPQLGLIDEPTRATEKLELFFNEVYRTQSLNQDRFDGEEQTVDAINVTEEELNSTEEERDLLLYYGLFPLRVTSYPNPNGINAGASEERASDWNLDGLPSMAIPILQRRAQVAVAAKRLRAIHGANSFPLDEGLALQKFDIEGSAEEISEIQTFLVQSRFLGFPYVSFRFLSYQPGFGFVFDQDGKVVERDSNSLDPDIQFENLGYGDRELELMRATPNQYTMIDAEGQLYQGMASLDGIESAERQLIVQVRLNGNAVNYEDLLVTPVIFHEALIHSWRGETDYIEFRNGAINVSKPGALTKISRHLTDLGDGMPLKLKIRAQSLALDGRTYRFGAALYPEMNINGRKWKYVNGRIVKGKKAIHAEKRKEILDAYVEFSKELRGVQNIRADIEQGVISDANQLRVVQELLGLHQYQLFAGWSAPGQDLESKRAYLSQLETVDAYYTGGLPGYRERVRQMVQEDADGFNPLAGKHIEAPQVQILNGPADHRFQEFEKIGLSAANRLAWVLPAGGKGERIGLEDGIKPAIQFDSAGQRSYMQEFIETIAAIQERSNELNNENIPASLMIMASPDNRDQMIELLINEDVSQGFQVLELTGAHYEINTEIVAGDPSVGTIYVLSQGKVPAVNNVSGDLSVSPDNPYHLATMPHGHVDVHQLVKLSGLNKKWKQDGRTQVVFFQDTNSNMRHTILAGVGSSISNKLSFNFMTFSRKAKESFGMIAKVVDPDGTLTAVRNIEYVVAELLLKDVGGDVGDSETGDSPFPGNANQFIVNLNVYNDALDDIGKLPELISIKKLEDGVLTRIEGNMQDIALLFPPEKIGVTQVDPRWFFFAAAKNNIAAAAANDEKGKSGEGVQTSEWHYFAANRLRLQAIDDGVVLQEFNGDPVRVHGVTINNGGIVSFDPFFALTQADLASKLRNIQIGTESVLVIQGSDIQIDDLELADHSALVVSVAKGASLQIKGIKVENDGWNLVPLSEEELKDASIPEQSRIRGYQLERTGQLKIEVTQAGHYIFDEKGLRKVSDTSQHFSHRVPLAGGFVSIVSGLILSPLGFDAILFPVIFVLTMGGALSMTLGVVSWSLLNPIELNSGSEQSFNSLSSSPFVSRERSETVKDYVAKLQPRHSFQVRVKSGILGEFDAKSNTLYLGTGLLLLDHGWGDWARKIILHIVLRHEMFHMGYLQIPQAQGLFSRFNTSIDLINRFLVSEFFAYPAGVVAAFLPSFLLFAFGSEYGRIKPVLNSSLLVQAAGKTQREFMLELSKLLDTPLKYAFASHARYVAVDVDSIEGLSTLQSTESAGFVALMLSLQRETSFVPDDAQIVLFTANSAPASLQTLNRLANALSNRLNGIGVSVKQVSSSVQSVTGLFDAEVQNNIDASNTVVLTSNTSFQATGAKVYSGIHNVPQLALAAFTFTHYADGESVLDSLIRLFSHFKIELNGGVTNRLLAEMAAKIAA